MKHSGKARQAGMRLIWITLVVLLAVLLAALVARFLSGWVLRLSTALVFVWGLFVLFTLYFFRDPDARVPDGKGLVLSPGHGKVDVVDTTTETRFLGGECQRISIFLSVFNVHVQNAPVSGRVVFLKHTAGQYLSALRSDCGLHNENVLLGIEASDPPNERIGVRLIAGVLARRIIPWVEAGEEIVRGERISLIQFGSRVEVYLPRRAKIRVRVGDRVVGGETILAVFD
ncbi:MAG TPA: phosphatidylserine decarboxylase [Verrucomicrobiae bacterium]